MSAIYILKMYGMENYYYHKLENAAKAFIEAYKSDYWNDQQYKDEYERFYEDDEDENLKKNAQKDYGVGFNGDSAPVVITDINVIIETVKRTKFISTMDGAIAVYEDRFDDEE